MFGLSKIYALAGIGLIAALFITWAFRVDYLRDGWRTRYITETGTVTATIRRVTGNNELKWRDANEQIEALADSRKLWKGVAGEQTAAIDSLGAEAERLRKLNATLRAKAEKEIAKRQRAIDRLAASANDPGERDNCQQQIAAAEAALDLIYQEGL